MAYGKLKADTLVYDNSGSDVEVTISALGGKADVDGQTFTGNVVLPSTTVGTTQSANNNSTKLATTAYTDAAIGAINLSNKANVASPTFTGTVTIPAGASISGFAPLASPTFTGTPTVPGYAPLAAPALTGTATGVNLTLSGDLTVNGTTTTVNSTNTTLSDNLLELNSGAGSNANDCGIIIERGSTGDNAIIAWDESVDKFTVGTTTGTASSTGNITITAAPFVASTVEDSKGDLRKIPGNTQSGAYTLVATDAGKYVWAAGNSVTVPNNVFSAGDAVTIVSDRTSDLTITKAIATMYNTADNTSDNRTLAAHGMATILFVSGTAAYISGSGLS